MNSQVCLLGTDSSIITFQIEDIFKRFLSNLLFFPVLIETKKIFFPRDLLILLLGRNRYVVKIKLADGRSQNRPHFLISYLIYIKSFHKLSILIFKTNKFKKLKKDE